MAPLNAVTAIIPAAIMALAALYGVLRGVDVFSAMADGARDGLRVVVSIFPPLVGLLTAVYMLRASGPWTRSRSCSPPCSAHWESRPRRPR